jgi:hypothetical protein
MLRSTVAPSGSAAFPAVLRATEGEDDSLKVEWSP